MNANEDGREPNGFSVLVVDDSEGCRHALAGILKSAGYEVREAVSGSDALADIAQCPPDLIFLDVRMPDMDGYRVCERLKADERTRDIPVMFISVLEEVQEKVRAFAVGGVDYVTKPFQPAETLARIATHLRLRSAQEEMRRSHAERVEESEERLRGITEAVQDAIVLLDDQGLVQFWNPAAERLFGYSAAEMIGQPAHAALAPDGSRAAADEGYARFAATGTGPVIGQVIGTRALRKDGSEFPAELSVASLRLRGRWHAVGVVRDVSERAALERQLLYQANFDLLTGLPNRTLLRDRLVQALAHARRRGGQVGVIAFDIDDFKLINDSLDFPTGDLLLKTIAARLNAIVREGDTVARSGGDEFVVVLPEPCSPEDAMEVAQRIRARLIEPVETERGTVHLTGSVGVSLYPRDGDDAEALLRNADAAMFRAKETGRDVIQFYTPELNARMLQRLLIHGRLRRALEREEFQLHYQPQVDLRTGKLCGFEALLRWTDAEIGAIPPGQFIPVAEETGLIVPLGDWVLQRACAQAREWEQAGLPPVTIAINLSARQLNEAGLAAALARLIEGSALTPSRLLLELTESAVMANPEEMQRRLHALKEVGVKLALDDFGTGYSSLGYLSRFAFDQLKIDRSFVQDIAESPHSAAITQSVIALGRALRLRVIAEGVESEAQLCLLRRLGCDEMQGFLYSRALAPADAGQLLREPRPLNDGCGEREEIPTLLVVDDELNVLRALHRLFHRSYRVLTAPTAQEAFDLLARHQVHVVLVDQRMPGLSGAELLARVQALYPDTVRMILSGYTDVRTVTDTVNRGGIYKFLTKPWDDEELRAQVADAFRVSEAVRSKGH